MDFPPPNPPLQTDGRLGRYAPSCARPATPVSLARRTRHENVRAMRPCQSRYGGKMRLRLQSGFWGCSWRRTALTSKRVALHDWRRGSFRIRRTRKPRSPPDGVDRCSHSRHVPDRHRRADCRRSPRGEGHSDSRSIACERTQSWLTRRCSRPGASVALWLPLAPAAAAEPQYRWADKHAP